MKRKSLETTMCRLDKLQSTIERLKQEYSDKDTQVDIIECKIADDYYYVTIWWLR